MNKKRLYGPISLGFMAIGSVAMEVISWATGISNPLWKLIGNGFHAGLVGALADWYAVHVLMHPAPRFMNFWPFKKHSDLLIRNRSKLEQNIVQMVQDELLTTKIILDHLEHKNVFGQLITAIQCPETLAKVVDFVQRNEVLVPLANQVDRPDIAASLDQLLKEQFGKKSIGKPLGEWLLKMIERGEHQAAWESVLNSLTTNLNSKESIGLINKVVRSAILGYLPTLRAEVTRPEVITRLEGWLRSRFEQINLAQLAGYVVRDAMLKGAHDPILDDLLGYLHRRVSEEEKVREEVRKKLDDAIESYKKGVGKFRKFFAHILERMSLDKEKAVIAIVKEIACFVQEVQQNRSHELRKHLQKEIDGYAEKLITGDKIALDGFEKLRKQLFSVKLDQVLDQFLTWIADTFEKELNSTEPSTGFMDFDAIARSVAAGASTMLDEVRKNRDHFIRTRVDGAIREYAAQLASEDTEATAFIERLKMDILQNDTTQQMLQSLLMDLKNMMLTQLDDKNSPLWKTIRSALEEVRNRFMDNSGSREVFIAWLRSKTKALVEQQHAHIGQMVNKQLKDFENARLVEIVDEKFGDDLQFVRLNGAVLGFLIGILLSAILLLMSRLTP